MPPHLCPIVTQIQRAIRIEYVWASKFGFPEDSNQNGIQDEWKTVKKKIREMGKVAKNAWPVADREIFNGPADKKNAHRTQRKQDLAKSRRDA